MENKSQNPLEGLSSKYEIILGSSSPRRRELMGMLELPFKVDTGHSVDESYPDTLPLTEIPAYLSKLKASAFSLNEQDNRLIITADTIVLLGDEVLGKPVNDEDACNMLARMASNVQTVVTGVTISTSERCITFSESTAVEFAPLSTEEIHYYVSHFHPLDKAGAYGIQEWIGAAAIKRIDGSFYNVMGLPIHRLYNQLKKFL